LENSASHAMTLAAPASPPLSSLLLGRSATASRSQDVAVSGVRQLSFAPPADDRIDDVDEDASTPYILGFHLAPRLRTEGIGHEAARREIARFRLCVIASSGTHRCVFDRFVPRVFHALVLFAFHAFSRRIFLAICSPQRGYRIRNKDRLPTASVLE